MTARRVAIALLASMAFHSMEVTWIAATVTAFLIFAGLLWWRERAAAVHLLGLLYPAVRGGRSGA